MPKPSTNSPSPEMLADKLNHLQALRRRMDSNSAVPAALFAQLQNRVMEAVDGNGSNLNETGRQLEALTAYLRQLEIFRLTASRFFSRTKEYGETFLQRSPHYMAAKGVYQQTLHNFRQGKYWQNDGMAWANGIMEEHMNAFDNDVAIYFKEKNGLQPAKRQPPAQLPTSASQPAAFPDPGSTLNSGRYASIKAAYLNMQLRALEDLLLNRPNKFADSLPQLREALLEKNAFLVAAALKAIEKLVASTVAEDIGNGITVHHKVMDISGKSEPNTKVVLKVNEFYEKSLKVSEEGTFVFEDVELRFGDNAVTLYNADFLFLHGHVPPMHVHLQAYHPFLGLYDPLTQKAFEAAEMESIVRCKSCGNYMYRFSVEENEGVCVMPKCDGKQFFNNNETEFWKQ